MRPQGGAIGFLQIQFHPKLKAYLEQVASTKHAQEAGEQRPLIEVFCEDLVTKQGVLLLPGSYYDQLYSNHFRIGFGRSDMPVALDKLCAYLHSILSDA